MIYQNELEERVFAPMYISEGMIYLGGRNCIMFCIDAERGKEIWSSYSHDTTTWFSGGSVSIGNMLFACASDEHSVVVFDKYTGEFLRLYPTQSNAYTKPIVHGDNIIVATVDVYSLQRSYIMEFDTKNHVELWQIMLDDCILSAPAIYNDVLYFGTDSGKIYNLVLNGD
jgi:outer membrane protein assembly factor BamB